MPTSLPRPATPAEVLEIARVLHHRKWTAPAFTLPEIERLLDDEFHLACFEGGDADAHRGRHRGPIFVLLGPIPIDVDRGYLGCEFLVLIRDGAAGLLLVDDQRAVPAPAGRRRALPTSAASTTA